MDIIKCIFKYLFCVLILLPINSKAELHLRWYLQHDASKNKSIEYKIINELLDIKGEDWFVDNLLFPQIPNTYLCFIEPGILRLANNEPEKENYLYDIHQALISLSERQDTLIFGIPSFLPDSLGVLSSKNQTLALTRESKSISKRAIANYMNLIIQFGTNTASNPLYFGYYCLCLQPKILLQLEDAYYAECSEKGIKDIPDLLLYGNMYTREDFSKEEIDTFIKWFKISMQHCLDEGIGVTYDAPFSYSPEISNGCNIIKRKSEGILKKKVVKKKAE